MPIQSQQNDDFLNEGEKGTNEVALYGQPPLEATQNVVVTNFNEPVSSFFIFVISSTRTDFLYFFCVYKKLGETQSETSGGRKAKQSDRVNASSGFFRQNLTNLGQFLLLLVSMMNCGLIIFAVLFQIFPLLALSCIIYIGSIAISIRYGHWLLLLCCITPPLMVHWLLICGCSCQCLVKGGCCTCDGWICCDTSCAVFMKSQETSEDEVDDMQDFNMASTQPM